MKTAFISVSNKDGLFELAQELVSFDVHLMASCGTAECLSGHGFDVLSIEDYLAISPLLDGRVKTLHPGLFSGILADRKNPKHMLELKSMNVEPIDFVIVDVYAFSEEQDIEHIDIGGVALLRAAAKNHSYCTVISDPKDYPLFIDELQCRGIETSLTFRKTMAARAFAKSAAYDAAISHWCAPEAIKPMPLEKTLALSYGENPHQTANFYNWPGETPNISLLFGKPLSYNNLLDLDAGIRLVMDFNTPVAAIIKHNNPCGVAKARSPKEAIMAAFHSDEKSAFGGIVVFNQRIDKEAALFLQSHFFEVIAAPDFTAEAVTVLAEKTRLRLVSFKPQSSGIEIRSALNGFLIQTPDVYLGNDNVRIPTIKKPDETLLADLYFAFALVRHMKSNAIVIVKNGITLGIGLGQTNRVDAVSQALLRASQFSLDNAVLASDGFFPFADSIECIAQTPIKAIIQPGGARRDQAVIDACNAYQLSMIITGKRGFKH